MIFGFFDHLFFNKNFIKWLTTLEEEVDLVEEGVEEEAEEEVKEGVILEREEEDSPLG